MSLDLFPGPKLCAHPKANWQTDNHIPRLHLEKKQRCYNLSVMRVGNPLIDHLPWVRWLRKMDVLRWSNNSRSYSSFSSCAHCLTGWFKDWDWITPHGVGNDQLTCCLPLHTARIWLTVLPDIPKTMLYWFLVLQNKQVQAKEISTHSHSDTQSSLPMSSEWISHTWREKDQSDGRLGVKSMGEEMAGMKWQ